MGKAIEVAAKKVKISDKTLRKAQKIKEAADQRGPGKLNTGSRTGCLVVNNVWNSWIPPIKLLHVPSPNFAPS